MNSHLTNLHHDTMNPEPTETQNLFTGVKWFDRTEVRDREKLSPEDLRYVMGWTIAPLGYGNIFYVAGRKLPDLLVVYVITLIFFQFSNRVVSVTNLSTIPLILFALLTLGMLALSFYSTYFLFRHGRRLSWNRGRYTSSWTKLMWPKTVPFETVDQLRASEKNFVKYNVIPSVVFVGLLLVLLAVVTVLE